MKPILMDALRPHPHPQQRRTCEELGVCLHPLQACQAACAQRTGADGMQRLAPARPQQPQQTEQPALPALPYGIEGPYRRAARSSWWRDVLAAVVLSACLLVLALALGHGAWWLATHSAHVLATLGV